MELFASPLNARYPRFCSASFDTDAAFGSHGSFFQWTPLSGAFLANPPFDPGFVAAMAARMEVLLSAADGTGALLTFVVVMPQWTMPRGVRIAWPGLAWPHLASPRHALPRLAILCASSMQLLRPLTLDARAPHLQPHLPAWQALRNSPHLTCTLTLPKAKHGYLEGGQQYGRGKAPLCAPSKHDSSVFVLQSSAAALSAPFSEPMQERLANAFGAG